jgi:hypothetical protein
MSSKKKNHENERSSSSWFLEPATHTKIRTTTLAPCLGLLGHTIKEETMTMNVACCRGLRRFNTKKDQDDKLCSSSWF